VRMTGGGQRGQKNIRKEDQEGGKGGGVNATKERECYSAPRLKGKLLKGGGKSLGVASARECPHSPKSMCAGVAPTRSLLLYKEGWTGGWKGKKCMGGKLKPCEAKT